MANVDGFVIEFVKRSKVGNTIKHSADILQRSRKVCKAFKHQQ